MADEAGARTDEAPSGPDSMAAAMAAAMVEGDDAKADELVQGELAAIASGEKVATGEGAVDAPEAEADADGAGKAAGAAQDGEKAQDAQGEGGGEETPQEGAGDAQDGAAGDGEGDVVTEAELKAPDAFSHIPEAERAAVTKQWDRVTTALKHEAETRAGAQEQFRALARPIAEAGFTDGQWRDVLWMGKALNGNDPATLDQLHTWLGQLQAHVGQRLGRAPAGQDPMELAENADLKALVLAGDLEAKHATEVAEARALKAQQGRMQQHRQAASQQGHAEAQATAQGKAQLDKLDAYLRENEPRYQEMLPELLGEVRKMKERGLPPHAWGDHMIDRYIEVKDRADAKAGGAKKGEGKARTQPLRPGAGGAPKTAGRPKSMQAAIAAAMLE